MKALIPDFEKETGIKVELESLSYDALQARLVSAFVAKTSDADVIAVDQMWLGQYLDNGWIIPLNDFVAKDPSIDLADFIPGGALFVQHVARPARHAPGGGLRPGRDVPQGHVRGAEHPGASDRDLRGLDLERLCRDAEEARRHDLRGDAGIPDGSLWIAALAHRPHVHPAFRQPRRVLVQVLPPRPWNFEPTLSGPAWEKSIDLYRQLYKLSPPEAINYVWFDAGTRFAKGDIGMFYWWTPYFYLVKNSGYMTGTKSDVMEKYATAALPKADGVPQTISLGGWSLGVPSSSAKQAAGYAFIKWATSKATQKKMAAWPDLNYQFSDFARASLYQDADLKAIYPYLDVQYSMMKQGNGKVTRPPVPGYTALESVLV